MVIVKLYGGLGNQMYQYATAVALAERLKTSVYTDLSWFEEVKKTPELTLRWYELDGFNIEPRLPGAFAKLTLKLRPSTLFKESSFKYLSEFERLTGNIVLDGYWQSYKYFEPYMETIRRTFAFPKDIKPANQAILAKMKASDSVLLHVRRGDYNTKRGREFHGLVSIEYYEKAIKDITKKIKQPTFFIFSDEIDWCKKHLKTDYPTEYIDSNGPNNGVEDMQLMSGCKHAIIANSSFSWWSAWLNTSANKIIYAPVAWFKGAEHEIDDRLPPSWIRI